MPAGRDQDPLAGSQLGIVGKKLLSGADVPALKRNCGIPVGRIGVPRQIVVSASWTGIIASGFS